jgi:hypothetical protein
MIITNEYLTNGKYCAFVSEEEFSEIKTWPNEQGATPRDMSYGYFDSKDYGRLHVYPSILFVNKLKSL